MTENQRPRFDPTINLGHILSLLAFLGTGLAAWQSMRTEITTLDGRLREQEKTIESVAMSVNKMAEVMVISARQDERLTAIIGRVERLEQRGQ